MIQLQIQPFDIFRPFFFQFPEDEQLTDGQKKAEKIKASFENPFKKVGCKIKLNLVARILSLSFLLALADKWDRTLHGNEIKI